jgi:O-antigen/teichoic acid export membrane protein
LIADILFTLFYRFASRGAFFFILILVAYYLSPDDVGVYGLVITTCYSLTYLFSLGSRHAIAFFLKDESFGHQALMSNVIFIFVLSMPIVLTMSYFIFSSISTGTDYYISVLAVSILLVLLLSYIFQGFFLGLDKISLFNKAEVFVKFSSLIITCGYIGFSTKIELVYILSAFFISACLGLIYTVYLLYSLGVFGDFRIFRFKDVSLTQVKTILKYGIPLSTSMSLSVFAPSICMWIINYNLNLSAAGVFFIAYKVTEIISEVATSAGMVVFSKSINKKFEDSIIQSINVSKYIAIIALVCSGFVFAFGNYLDQILENKYGEGFSTILFFLLLGLPFLTFSRVVSSVFYASGYGGKVFVSQLFGFIVNCSICILLINIIGVYSAVISIFLGRFVSVVFLFHQMRRLTSLQVSDIFRKGDSQ